MKLRKVKIFLFIFIIFKLPLFLMAADKKGGMPQLDPSSFSSQVFWLIIIFTILFILINYIFMPKIIKVHSERKKIIDENIHVAERNNKTIEDLNNRIEENISKAKLEAEKIFRVSYEKNMKFFNSEIKTQMKRFDDRENKILTEIASKKKEVEKNLEVYCITLSDNIYKKILKKDEKISKENFKKLKGNFRAN